eukprot:jgi/Tetstr1/457024/TSEL_043688.t1
MQRPNGMARRENCARCVLAISANQPAASEFCRHCGRSTTIDGLAVVGEEALVSAVTEATYDRLNSHHMQGGLKRALATFRGVPADLLVSICEARSDMWHKVRVTAPGGSKKARAELHMKRGAHGGVRKTDRGDIVSTLYPLSLDFKEEPFRGHISKLKVVKGTVYLHTGVVAAKEDTDLQLPTGYSVDPSDPKAWPFLPTFDDPKAYAMRELQAQCEAHFMHLVGPMDDSDVLRSVMGWDCSVPIPPPLPRQIGGYVFQWEVPPGESEADKLEREAFWIVRSELAR